MVPDGDCSTSSDELAGRELTVAALASPEPASAKRSAARTTPSTSRATVAPDHLGRTTWLSSCAAAEPIADSSQDL
jgi:hypothetical protein